jgi:hypothetical protein
VDDGTHELIENAECDEALLGIVEAIIFVGKGWTLKHSGCVDKVEAVLFDIQLALRITPREPHESLYIQYAYASNVLTRSAMRAQLCRRAAKKIKDATSAAEDSVSSLRLDPRRVKVVACESIEIRHNLSTVSIPTTVNANRRRADGAQAPSARRPG